jgi:hypothetical protein
MRNVGWLVTVTALAVVLCAGGTAMAVTPGQVVAWGNDGNGQLGDGANVDHASAVSTTGLGNVVQVSGCEAFSMALTATGSGAGARPSRYAPATAIWRRLADSRVVSIIVGTRPRCFANAGSIGASRTIEDRASGWGITHQMFPLVARQWP